MSLTRPSSFMLPSSVAGVIPVCDTRASLAAVPTNVVDRPAFLNEGKRRGFFYLDTYVNWSTVVAIDAVQGLVVRSTFDPSYVWVRAEREITPQMFGAAADYGVTNTNDYAAIVNWFTVLRNVYVKSKGITGLLSGRYYVAQTLVLNFDTASGAKGGSIRGNIKNSDGLYFAAGYYCHFRTNDTVFYETLKDFVITTN
ncbi:hypothetical protein [Rhizobium favelukesii]|uniref:hypothetical protein n=1 Tax=Rhizobium favelukesii TaxID=348824 RepID=UPI00215E6B6A|nr:hypothetical protein [Rhizobium favelukesii]MCS0459543.1 hypothetical protein [Rhizobium favelukesii]